MILGSRIRRPVADSLGWRADVVTMTQPLESGPIGPSVRPDGDDQFPVWSAESLMGRADDVARITGLIEAGTRLITVTGPGGVGKTRLVIHLARRIAAEESRRVVLVPLSDFRLVADAIRSIASVLDVRAIPSELGDDQLPEGVTSALGESGTLLVLDNAEHLPDLAGLVDQLLMAAPSLQIVVTSQRRLALGIEREEQIAPLSLPDVRRSSGSTGPSPALELFIFHARRVWPEFDLTPALRPVVTEICRQVDGVPLAIELAAARLRILSPTQLRDRLAVGLPALGGGPRDLPARQQTIRGAIAWGYDLLSPVEQRLFRRLTVFIDGFDLVTAEQVCADPDDEPGDPPIAPDAVVDLLSGLVDASFLTSEPRDDGERRFLMLGIIRRFGLELLERSGEGERTRRRHAVWFAGRAVLAEPAMLGSQQADWLRWLDGNAANVRAAEETTFTVGPVADGVRLVGSLWRYWDIRGQLAEARRAMERALPHLDAVPPGAQATLLTSLGHVLSDLGEYELAERLYTDALVIRRDGDDPGQVAGLLNILGILLQTRGEFERARSLHQESLAIRTRRQERRGVALSLLNLGRVAYHLGDCDRAAERESEAIAILHELGDQDQIAYACHAIGLTAIRQGQPESARALLTRSEGLFVELGDRFGVAYARQALGQIALLDGDRARAADLMGQAIDLRRDIGYVWGVVDSTEGIGELTAMAGRPEIALQLLLVANRFREMLGAPLDDTDRHRHAATVARLRRELGRVRAAESASRAGLLSRNQTAELALSVATELAATVPEPPADRPVTIHSAAPPVAVPPGRYGLTPREREVLSLVAEGKSDREIADRLFLSRRTVSEHVRHILGKLETPTRTAATALALRAGLI